MPKIISAATAFPQFYYEQEDLISEFRRIWSNKFHNFERIEAFHRNVLVGGRHLALPLEAYRELQGFGKRNDAYISSAIEIGEKVLNSLFSKCNIDPEEISFFCTTTVTGLMVPSLEARLMNRLSFRPSTKRLPLFGLGCLGGVAGINRVVDYLQGHPKEAAILLAVELCSLTVQLQDTDLANLVSSGLFGDGSAAVLLVGDEHPLATRAEMNFLNSASHFFPNTERVMGWDIIDSGFKVVLGPEVPEIVKNHLPSAIIELKKNLPLRNQGHEIDFYVAHPGGPKVLQAMEEALNLGREEQLYLSWEGLRKRGNMSSVSVLHVLEQTLSLSHRSGSLGLMVAMGPAFCAELSMWEKV